MVLKLSRTVLIAEQLQKDNLLCNLLKHVQSKEGGLQNFSDQDCTFGFTKNYFVP
jgi:hypothetical protein